MMQVVIKRSEQIVNIGLFPGSHVVWSWLVLAVALIGICQETASAQWTEGGYALPTSTSAGDTIHLYLSSAVPEFDVQVYRFAEPEFPDSKKLVETFHAIKGRVQSVADSAYANGCKWIPTVSFVVPGSWQSGFYGALFPVSGEKSVYACFVVKPANPGGDARVLLVLSTMTYQAYNVWGGNSLYGPQGKESNIAGRSFRVSFERPYAGVGVGQYAIAEQFLARWMKLNGYSCDFCADLDLDRDPGLLQHYAVVVFCGHDEYWSLPMRRQTETYLKHGGNIAFFCGNSVWWQVRFSADHKSMVCYKDASLDPLTGIQDSLVTVNWYDEPVSMPENSLTGLSYRNAGMVDYGSTLPGSEGYGRYIVYNAQSWVFRGASVQDGDTIGGGGFGPIVGYETDGAPFYWRNGIPVPILLQSTPAGLEILGVSPARMNPPTTYHATMSVFKEPGGGIVFNAATIDWAWGLYPPSHPDPVVDRITRNVLDRLLAGHVPPRIVDWSPLRLATDQMFHESYTYTIRDTTASPGQTLTFRVDAVDEDGGQLQYWWYRDSTFAGAGNVYRYTVDARSGFGTTITAVVTNEHDSSMVSWRVFTPLLHDTRSLNSDTLAATIGDDTDAVAYVLERGSALSSSGLVRRWETVDSLPVQTTPSGDRTIYFLAIPDTTEFFAFRLKRYSVTGGIRYSNSVYHGRGIAPLVDESGDEFLHVYEIFPLPSAGVVHIEYTIASDAEVEIDIYGLIGAKICTALNKRESAGIHLAYWNARDDRGMSVSPGIYFARVTARGDFLTQSVAKKILVLR